MGTMLIIGMGPAKKGPKHMNPMQKYLSKGAEKEPLQEVEDSGHSGTISFSMPTGFKVPDGVKDGESFDAMATLKVQDGKLVLSELDGAPVSDESEESEDMDTEMDSETPEAPEAAEDSEPSSQESEPESDYDSEESDDEEDGKMGFLDLIEKKVAKRKK